MKIIANKLEASHAKVAIIVARFNSFINNSLINGAISVLERVGQLKNENICTIWVPGIYEIPLTVNTVIIKKKYNGLIVIATVIKGKTFHFEFISKDLNAIISSMSIKNNLPISSGILYVNNIQQAIERAGTKFGNKGEDAALSLLEMINLLKNI
ncbi:MAG: 6,-dimethyl-8-ribityllumazine synthase [Wigglesworthia glossinidia]|nr:6,-dimethyl-8-ribityllumazine synthase [Wigglesworthia glossinidia]